MAPEVISPFQARCNSRLQQQQQQQQSAAQSIGIDPVLEEEDLATSAGATDSRVEELPWRDGSEGADEDESNVPWSTIQCGPATFSDITCETCGSYLGQGFDANCHCGECPIPPMLPTRECDCRERATADDWEEEEEDDEEVETEAGSVRVDVEESEGVERGRAVTSSFPAVTQQAEPMLEVPAALRADWVCRVMPLGLRVLVKTDETEANANASNSHSSEKTIRTTLYDASTGEQVRVFHSNIPSDSVLDAVYFVLEDTSASASASAIDSCEYTTVYHSVHVLDVLRYAGSFFMNICHETREYWLHSKFEERGLEAVPVPEQEQEQEQAAFATVTDTETDPGLGTEDHVYSVKLVPVVDCTYESLLALYSSIQSQLEVQQRYRQSHYIQLDGLQFVHKAGFYEVGVTPLVLHFKDAITAATAPTALTTVELDGLGLDGQRGAGVERENVCECEREEEEDNIDRGAQVTFDMVLDAARAGYQKAK